MIVENGVKNNSILLSRPVLAASPVTDTTSPIESLSRRLAWFFQPFTDIGPVPSSFQHRFLKLIKFGLQLVLPLFHLQFSLLWLHYHEFRDLDCQFLFELQKE